MILGAIILATVLGGVLSVLAAALLSFRLLARWTPRLVAYAVGVLLAAAFLHILPHAAEDLDVKTVLAVCLAGVLGFFVLEKLALWRHSHVHADADGRVHTHGAVKPTGAMILIGDALHNFVDGILIAAAFLTDPALGWALAIGVIAHEIPQEVGDFAILIDAGYSRRRALAYNALSGAAAVAGGVLGYFALSGAEALMPYVLAVSAASFIYIAIADLIPELHRRWDLGSLAAQVALIGAGILTLVLLHELKH